MKRVRSVGPRRWGRALRGTALAALLLVAAFGPGCRSTPESPPALAEVTVGGVNLSALRELVALRLRAHDWYLVRQERTLLVFQRPQARPLQLWLDSEARSPVVLRAEISLAPVSDGIRLQGTVRRIDTSKNPPRQTAESPKELQRILDGVRQGFGAP